MLISEYPILTLVLLAAALINTILICMRIVQGKALARLMYNLIAIGVLLCTLSILSSNHLI
jgi:hypothetical protein